MISKIKTGANFKGVLRYNEKENAEIIAKNMAGENQKELTKEFILGHELNPRVEKPVKHHILSFSPDDKEKLNPERLEEITNEYLQNIGYSNNQFVAYLHNDTNNLHLHLIVNKVNRDGKNTHLKLERKRARNVVMDIERKYNLVKTPAHSLDKSKSYDKTYAETKERLKKEGKKTDKEIIRDSIKQALEKRPLSEYYFSSFLKQQGINLIKKGRGYQFEYNGRTYKASNIDRKYSFAKLNKFFEENYKGNEDRKHRAEQYNTPKPEEKTEKQPEQKQEGKTQEQPKQKEKIHIPSKKEQHRQMVKSLASDIAKLAEQRKLDYNALVNELSDLHKSSLQDGFNYTRDDYMNRVKNMIAKNLNETEASHFESHFDDTLKGNKLNQESNQDKQKSLFMPHMTQEQKQFDDRMKALSSNFANEIKSGNADYSKFMEKLNFEFPIAQKLGYSNSFRIFTTDIMNYVNNQLPDDLNLKTKFMQDYQTAQNKILQDKEQDKSHLIDNQDLTQNKNKNKNKGLKL